MNFKKEVLPFYFYQNMCAWGIFQKIGRGLKKAFNWVKDKVVKPVAKFLAPVAKPIASVVKTAIPGAAPIVNVAEKVVDKLSGSGSGSRPPPAANTVGYGGHGIRINPQDIPVDYIRNPKIKLAK